MPRKKPYGRAYRISESDASAYERTTRPRKYTPNPLGVTAMASVNGRGAYRSARAVSAGKTRAERDARARTVMRNGESDMRRTRRRRAGFLKNAIGRRLSPGQQQAALAKAEEKRKKNESRAKAAETRARNKAKSEDKKTSTKKAPAKSGKGISKGSSPSRQRAGQRLAAYSAALRSGKKEDAAKRSALRKVPLKEGEKFKGSVGRKNSASKPKTAKARTVGAPKGKTYTRIYVTDPKTGKKRLSWLYKDAKGKKRKIPSKKIIESGYMKRDRLVKARELAAKRVLESGGTFIPNAARKKPMASKKKGTPKQVRNGKRSAAYQAAKKAGKTEAQAISAAIRKVPLVAGDTFKGKSKKATSKKSTAKKSTAKKSTKRRKTTYRPVAGIRVCKPATKKKGKLTKAQRSASAKKAARTRKRNASMTPNRRKYTMNGKRRSQRHMGRRRRRNSYRRNSFMARLKDVLKTGLFVAGGFLTHKVLTGFAIQGVDNLAPTMFANSNAATWKKPAIGFGVLLVGIPLSRMVLKKNSTEVAAGMAASWIQSAIVSTLNALNQPTWAGHLSGYSNSRAYALRGMERNATSIMPHYSRLSGFQQAAAGMGAFQQAAAGFQQAAAGTGEYFQANATGEYFAPNNLQGVGSYEGAGQLALQAAAGAQDIDDGIRPDSDIDGIMDLAEAAAGLRGTGEFYSAVRAGGGRVIEKRVGQQSQWIPNGPLWAGTDTVDNTQATSELSAGILQRGGGNGILSA